VIATHALLFRVWIAEEDQRNEQSRSEFDIWLRTDFIRKGIPARKSDANFGIWCQRSVGDTMAGYSLLSGISEVSGRSG
jgi:hypothetical protein